MIFFISNTFTYATYDSLIVLMIYLWFTYDSLMKWAGGVCLSYLWKIPLTYFTYDSLCLLISLIVLMPIMNYLLYIFYLWFTYDLLMFRFWNGLGGVRIILRKHTIYLWYLCLLVVTYFTYDTYFTYEF